MWFVVVWRECAAELAAEARMLGMASEAAALEAEHAQRAQRAGAALADAAARGTPDDLEALLERAEELGAPQVCT